MVLSQEANDDNLGIFFSIFFTISYVKCTH